MKPTTALILLGLGLALTGCDVTSVYPFYTEKDLVFNPKLLGTWKSAKNAGSKETWTVTRSGATSYPATVKDDSTHAYDAHLFKLEGQLFFNLTPNKRHDGFIPSHYLIKVIQVEPTLQVTMLNNEWLDELLKATPTAMRHLEIKPGKRPS